MAKPQRKCSGREQWEQDDREKKRAEKDKPFGLLARMKATGWEPGQQLPVDEKSSEVLSELAYDMDFYEPNDAWRKGDRSYYDDKRLEEEIKDVIKKLDGAKLRE